MAEERRQYSEEQRQYLYRLHSVVQYYENKVRRMFQDGIELDDGSKVSAIDFFRQEMAEELRERGLANPSPQEFSQLSEQLIQEWKEKYDIERPPEQRQHMDRMELTYQLVIRHLLQRYGGVIRGDKIIKEFNNWIEHNRQRGLDENPDNLVEIGRVFVRRVDQLLQQRSSTSQDDEKIAESLQGLTLDEDEDNNTSSSAGMTGDDDEEDDDEMDQ